MADPNQLVLHEDAQIIPIADVANRVRDRLPTSGGTHVLSRPGTRHGSMVLDEQGAKLVRLLAGGRLLTDALKELARDTAISPDVIAGEAYPLIRALIDRKYLKKRGTAERPATSPALSFRYKPKDSFEGHTILRRIQVLEDTEIYQIQLNNGVVGALKLIRKGSRTVISAFKRESLILERLGGLVTPAIVSYQVEGDGGFIIMEWIQGEQSHLWAARVRNLAPQQRYTQTLSLCREIVRAYVQLHSQGVMHSDIYAKNVLIRHDGTARIVDLGFSFHREVDAIIGKLPRNANPYFKSPDLAQLELEDKRSLAPSPSPSSDIYSVGALLYFLVTGTTYIDFALENNAVLRQICEAPMVPFAQRGLKGWNSLQNIISTMLSKDPSARYTSMEECLAQLSEVQDNPAEPDLFVTCTSLDSTTVLKGLADTVEPNALPAPSASLNYGSAGIAYALLKSAHALGDRALVPSADLWASYSGIWIEGSDGSLCKEIGITPEVIGPYSVLHRSTGVTLIKALIAHSQLDAISLRQTCTPFVTGIHKTEALLEFIFGKAGLLNCIQQLAFLVADNERLLLVGNDLAADMIRQISSCSSLEQSSVKYVGFAHGWAGILYSLLAWGRKYDTTVVEQSLNAMQQLADYRVDTALGSFWPLRFDRPIEEGDMPAWCNGTAGFTLLWTEAYLATNDSKWLDLARSAALHCATHFDNSISVCCGLAGRAYALAILGQVSGEQQWLDAAHRCLARATRTTPDMKGYPHSLFKGFIGLELAKLEVAKVEEIGFPTLASDIYGEPLPVGLG